MVKKTAAKASIPAVEDILSDLIKIQTVNPPGGETTAAQYLKSSLINTISQRNH